MRFPARFLAAWWLVAIPAPAAPDSLIAKADALSFAPNTKAPYLGLFTHVEPRLDLAGKLATLNQIIRDNPHIVGFTLKIHWRQLHPEPQRRLRCGEMRRSRRAADAPDSRSRGFAATVR